jgi:hypothetical protein
VAALKHSLLCFDVLALQISVVLPWMRFWIDRQFESYSTRDISSTVEGPQLLYKIASGPIGFYPLNLLIPGIA